MNSEYFSLPHDHTCSLYSSFNVQKLKHANLFHRAQFHAIPATFFNTTSLFGIRFVQSENKSIISAEFASILC